jgi:hypothetical protein
VVGERVVAEEEAETSDPQVVGETAEVPLDHPLGDDHVMPRSALEVPAQRREAARLDRLELPLHRRHVGCQGQLGAIVEDEPVCRVDAAQLESLVERRSQRLELRRVEARHDEERRPGVEAVPVVEETAAPAARLGVLLDDGDRQPGSSEMGCGRETADARADDDDRTATHARPPILGASGLRSVATPGWPAIAAAIDQAARMTAPRLVWPA